MEKNVIISMSPRNVLGRNFERCGIAANDRHRFTCMDQLRIRSEYRILFVFFTPHFILRTRVRTVRLDLTSRVANYIEEVFTFHIMA